jgi:hypothetical protein
LSFPDPELSDLRNASETSSIAAMAIKDTRLRFHTSLREAITCHHGLPEALKSEQEARAGILLMSARMDVLTRTALACRFNWQGLTNRFDADLTLFPLR